MGSDFKINRRFGNRSVYASIAIIIIAVAAIAAWQIYPMTRGPHSSSSVYADLPPMNLTLVGANGTQRVLHASDIAQLTAFTGEGGLETNEGSIEDFGNYTGVSLISSCALVGGIGVNDSVQVTGSDGYSMVFSYNQTNGNGFVTYDPVTGVRVPNGGPLTLVIAYHKNGANLTYDGGAPLRLAIVGPEGLCTNSTLWVKWIAKIQIMPAIPAIAYVNLPPMNLTLVGANGTQRVLHASDIARLTSFTDPGGFETSVGRIGGVGNYTGVKLVSLCALVGGIGVNDSVQVTGSDGYSMVFSYNQTNGNGFVTYDPVTGVRVPNGGPLTLVIAYHKNGANMTHDDGGPLRLVVLGKEGLLTDGHCWVKWVAKIQILPAIVDWTLILKDASEVNKTRTFEYNVTRSYFEAGEAPNCHVANWTDKNGNVWIGIPLWLLAASVDGWTFSMSFNDSLAESNGYEVVVISQSGGNRTFTSSIVANAGSGMIVANELNGAVLPEKYWPLMLVGSAVPSDDMVVNIAEIELIFLGS